MEKVADITAWLPITAAQVATMNTGQNIGSAHGILESVRLTNSSCVGIPIYSCLVSLYRNFSGYLHGVEKEMQPHPNMKEPNTDIREK